MLSKQYFTVLLSFLILLTINCAYIQTQVKHYKDIEEDFSSRLDSRAAERIEKAANEGKYEGKDKVLYFLDMGIALHFAGRYKESNEYLNRAEFAIEENFTKSVSKIAVSFLLNDNALDYSGEDYEDIFTNIIKTLNYIHLRNQEDAMVEVRRINLKLNRMRDKYSNMAEQLGNSEKLQGDETEVNFIPGETNLRHSITGSYLSMLGYRNMGKWNDAEIDRKRLIEASSGSLKDFSKEVLRTTSDSMIPVYTLCFTGKSPVKVQSTLLLDYDPDLNMARVMLPGEKDREINSFKYRGDDELHLKFAVPTIVKRKTGIHSIRTIIDGKAYGRMYLIEDLGNIAEETFKVKKPLIYLRAALRTLIKASIDSKTKEKIDQKYEEKEEDGEGESEERGKNKLMAGLLKFAVDAITDVTENADLRCWRTMPGKVYGGKIDLAPGEYEIFFEYLDRHGNVIDAERKNLFVNKNSLNIIEGVSYR
jgi:uncharacterized protein